MTAPIRVPSMPDAHSHAFQRGLRGRGEVSGPDDFWTWREAMYELAGALDPDSIRRASAATFAEMVGAGYGAVGEFHYVHHQPGGTPYDDPNAMAKAVAEAAREAGLPIVLLPAAYHRAGWDGGDLPPSLGQRRFCDPDVDAFLARVDALRTWAAGVAGVDVGVAAHSVRAVPGAWLSAIARYADRHGLVRHVHAAEQRREVDEVRAEHECSPVELLQRTGFLGPRTSLVHGIHVGARDIRLLAESGTVVVACPTTEGNLGDGYPPVLAYRDAGVRLALGSDSQIRVDPFEEARELETGGRREGQTRYALLGHSADVWDELCANGRASLGLDELGEVTIDLSDPSLGGVREEDIKRALVTCAAASAVRPVR